MEIFYLYAYRAWTIIIQDRRIMQLIDRVGAEVRPMLLVLRLHLLVIILECQRGCVTAQCSQYRKNNSIVIPARLFPNHPRWSLKIKRFSERLLWYYVYFVRGIILQTLWRDINKLKIKKIKLKSFKWSYKLYWLFNKYLKYPGDFGPV